jgi:hypothetical protein
VNDLANLDHDALMSKVRAKIGPSDLDQRILDASVRLGMAVALETLLPAALRFATSGHRDRYPPEAA